MASLYRDIQKIDGVKVGANMLLAPFTSFKIGGAAELFVQPLTISGLERLLELLVKKSEPYKVLGCGTNLLIDDNGLGVVISLDCLKETPQILTRLSDSTYLIQVGAGMKLQSLLAWALKHSFVGLEPLAGIPASVGGAVFMNAGANQISMQDIVEEILVVGPGGSQWLSAKDMGFGYRTSGLSRDSIVAKAKLRLKKGNASESLKRIKQIMKKRRSSQPLTKANAGCIFKNPQNISAGALIEQCGLKGVRIGEAEVSPVHANFIVNLGRATTIQVLELMDLIQTEVKQQANINLEPEIHIWTERA